MSNRFYSSHPIVGPQATLDGPEAHHLLHVMRLAAGAEVTLFDGSGFEFRARIIGKGRAEVEFEILDRAEVDRELPFDLTLGVALPKGDRQRWLVEKVVELGVTRSVPLRTERGVAQPTQGALDRLRRTVVEASKQCGRNRLMQVSPPMDFEEFLKAASKNNLRLIAHPGGRRLFGPGCSFRGLEFGAAVVVGPEGGFAEFELECASKLGWEAVDLGPRILRVETAAIAIAAAVGSAPIKASPEGW